MHIPPENIQKLVRFGEESTVPIALRLGEQMSHHGMGILFGIGTYEFLVTAWHVVEKCQQVAGKLYIPSDSDPGRAYRLDGDWIGMKPLDLGVCRLTGACAEHVRRHRFVRLNEVVRRDLSRNTPCFVFGFPTECVDAWRSSGSPATIRRQPLAFVTQVAIPEDPPSGVKEHVQFLIDANLCGFADTLGNTATAPASLGGISGGPVWVCDGDVFDPSWQLRNPELAGVQVSVITRYGHTFVKCVHFASAVRLMHTYFPSTKELDQKLQQLIRV